MSKRIYITPQQLSETEGAAYQYLNCRDDSPICIGDSLITVGGYTEAGKPAKPLPGDRIAGQLSTQSYNRFRAYGTRNGIPIREGYDEGLPDKKDDELDTLADGHSNNDTTRVPDSILRRLDMLLSQMSNSTPKQKAMVLNKIIEKFDLRAIPVSWRRQLAASIYNAIEPTTIK